jgi:hypothetical protein
MRDRTPPVFAPEALAVIYAAFDEAWEAVKVDQATIC